MILDNLLQTVINAYTKKHWESKGYFEKCGTVIFVHQNELPDNSHVVEERQCDCCGKIYSTTHQKMLRSHSFFNADYCPYCVSHNEEIAKIKKEKTIQTSLSKYGTESPSQSDIVKQHKVEANLEKYGVKYTTQLDSVKEKSIAACMEKYGVSHPAKTKEFHKKIHATMVANGTTPTSRQQLWVYEAVKMHYPNYQVELNFPLSDLLLDVAIFTDGKKLNIEYDGWYWHQDRAKDYRRDMFVESQDYKVLRIKSGALLPGEEELFKKIDTILSNDKKYCEIVLSDWKEK